MQNRDWYLEGYKARRGSKTNADPAYMAGSAILLHVVLYGEMTEEECQKARQEYIDGWNKAHRKKSS